MIKKQLLPYINNEVLFPSTEKVLKAVEGAVENAETRLYTNAVDPFSAIFDTLRQDITLSQWVEQEKARQIQKTMQNALGTFHEEILGAIQGWAKLPVGHVFDVINVNKKIIAEIKNKHNTTKGSDQKAIYDNLRSQLKTPTYKDYKAYFVQVVPKGKRAYDKLFTPSDNTTHKRRPKNKNIHVIDGRSFYDMSTGIPNSLKMLYETLPFVIADILKKSPNKVTNDSLFKELFDRVY